MEKVKQELGKSRGGAKRQPSHIALMIISTLLLTLAAVLLIMHMNVLGIIVMIAGIAVRYLDIRL